jgi:hypothetical protein
MLHVGLDLSRRKVDVCLLNDEGVQLDQLAVAPDVDSLRALAKRIDEVHVSRAGFHGGLVSRILSSGEETLRGHGTSEEISR